MHTTRYIHMTYITSSYYQYLRYMYNSTGTKYLVPGLSSELETHFSKYSQNILKKTTMRKSKKKEKRNTTLLSLHP